MPGGVAGLKAAFEGGSNAGEPSSSASATSRPPTKKPPTPASRGKVTTAAKPAVAAPSSTSFAASSASTSSTNVPEWKRKLLERKAAEAPTGPTRAGSTAAGRARPTTTIASATAGSSSLPTWKERQSVQSKVASGPVRTSMAPTPASGAAASQAPLGAARGRGRGAALRARGAARGRGRGAPLAKTSGGAPQKSPRVPLGAAKAADANLPAWKADLLKRKQAMTAAPGKAEPVKASASGAGPTRAAAKPSVRAATMIAPSAATVSILGTKELPAWKKRLLESKKAAATSPEKREVVKTAPVTPAAVTKVTAGQNTAAAPAGNPSGGTFKKPMEKKSTSAGQVASAPARKAPAVPEWKRKLAEKKAAEAKAAEARAAEKAAAVAKVTGVKVAPLKEQKPEPEIEKAGPKTTAAPAVEVVSKSFSASSAVPEKAKPQIPEWKRRIAERKAAEAKAAEERAAEKGMAEAARKAEADAKRQAERKHKEEEEKRKQQKAEEEKALKEKAERAQQAEAAATTNALVKSATISGKRSAVPLRKQPVIPEWKRKLAERKAAEAKAAEASAAEAKSVTAGVEAKPVVTQKAKPTVPLAQQAKTPLPQKKEAQVPEWKRRIAERKAAEAKAAEAKAADKKLPESKTVGKAAEKKPAEAKAAEAPKQNVPEWKRKLAERKAKEKAPESKAPAASSPPTATLAKTPAKAESTTEGPQRNAVAGRKGRAMTVMPSGGAKPSWLQALEDKKGKPLQTGSPKIKRQAPLAQRVNKSNPRASRDDCVLPTQAELTRNAPGAQKTLDNKPPRPEEKKKVSTFDQLPRKEPTVLPSRPGGRPMARAGLREMKRESRDDFNIPSKLKQLEAEEKAKKAEALKKKNEDTFIKATAGPTRAGRAVKGNMALRSTVACGNNISSLRQTLAGINFNPLAAGGGSPPPPKRKERPMGGPPPVLEHATKERPAQKGKRPPTRRRRR